MQPFSWLPTTLIDDQQLLAAKPDVNYKELTSQPSPQDFLVLTRVKGVVSVGQLCSVSGLGREKTLAAIQVLLDVGLLQEVDADGNPIARTKPAPEPEPEPEPELELEPEPEPEPEPEHEPERQAPDPVPPSNDATAVMSSAEAVAIASMMPDRRDDEPESHDPDAGVFVPDAQPAPREVIAIPAPEAPVLGDFVVDNQPVATVTEEYIVPTRVPDDEPLVSGPIVVNDIAPEIDDGPIDDPPPVQHTSFETVVPTDDDDDLFEPDSPAHIARVEGRAPIKRDRGKVRVEEAQAAAQRAREAPPKVSSINPANYRQFPVEFASYQSPHPPIAGLDPETQREIDFVFDHLEYLDFYQLFGVEHTADRKQIRSRYFDMSKQFHPDKFFRDDVGAVRERVDAIFRFVTKGYQTLSKKNKRAEYDQALERARAQAEQMSADEERKREMAADMLERRATQLEQQGQLAQAAAELKKVGTLRRDAHALVKAASLFLRANQKLDEAASLARAAVRELPGEVEPRLVLGQIYEKNEMFAEAAAVFGEAAEIAPNNPSVRVHLERVRSQH